MGNDTWRGGWFRLGENVFSLAELQRRKVAEMPLSATGTGRAHVAHELAVRHRPQPALHLQRPGVDVKQVSGELGVRCILEGSLRKAGSKSH
jgi:hypothetical protein